MFNVQIQNSIIKRIKKKIELPTSLFVFITKYKLVMNKLLTYPLRNLIFFFQFEPYLFAMIRSNFVLTTATQFLVTYLSKTIFIVIILYLKVIYYGNFVLYHNQNIYFFFLYLLFIFVQLFYAI